MSWTTAAFSDKGSAGETHQTSPQRFRAPAGEEPVNPPVNPKAFCRCVHSRLATRARVDDFVTENGAMASTVAAKANALADVYSRVFCWDKDPADFPVINLHYEGPLIELQVTPEQVQGKLCGLCPTASPVPDTVHPKILRELAAPPCRPLTDLFNHSLAEGRGPKNGSSARLYPFKKRTS